MSQALTKTVLFFCSFLLVMLAIPLEASKPYQPKIANPLNESWRWKAFPELEGKGIRYIAESPSQKVWVSCNEGVMEYDGYNWKTHNASNGLNISPVEHLLVTKDETIYATSERGIFRFDGQQWDHFFALPENRTFNFHGIEQLKDESIIAYSDWGFIHFIKNGTIRFYTSDIKIGQLKDDLKNIKWISLPKESLTDAGDLHYASDVLELRNGEVWFAVTTSLEIGKILKFYWSEVENGRIKKYEVVESKDDFNLGEDQKLLQAADGRIWVINSTSNKGINVFDGNSWQSIHLNKLFGGDEYMADIVQSANGTIWISSMARIMAWNKGTWQIYRAPQYPVPANRVILQNSQSDHLWAAGYKSKVLLLDFSTDQWLTYEDLSFQCEPNPEEQWFLERNNRIVLHRANEWTSYGVEDGLMEAPIRVIKTSKGQVWAAGSHNGVAATALLKNGYWERHMHPKVSWGIDYRAVFEAKDGTLWFGGAVDADKKDGFDSGILQLPNPTAGKLNWIHHVFGENGLSQGNTYGIGQSKDGRIWIGGTRLLFYDGNGWNPLPDDRLQQYVNCIHSTENLLIVGSRYYGVFVYDGEHWENYNATNGLSGNTIISIDALSDSTFIVATENDICKFDGTSWTQGIFPENLNLDFEGGTIMHTNKYIWTNHVPRSWKRRVYQGSVDQSAGEWAFFTTRYLPSEMPPETSFDFFLEEVSPDGNSLISWKGKDFYGKSRADKLMFSYRMDGGAWSPFFKDNKYTFTSLPSGKHKLEVRARDLDFNVDPTPAVIEFKVLPPIWKQQWFIALVLAFLITFGIYEYRVISKKIKLEALNNTLQEANLILQENREEIERQNKEILDQQQQILEQSGVLEVNNRDLEERNEEIRLQRDQLQEMVLQVERLSKAKLGFFTNISHELRTPLTLILGPVSQLRTADDSLGKKQRQNLYGIIDRNASRLLKLINQLLEMRRVEHSTLELKPVNVNLSKFISQVVDLFSGLAVRRNIDLDFYNKSSVRIASMDTDKVEKILVNLLSNAFKHTSEEGRISVALDQVNAEEHELNTDFDKYFKIVVSDTGAGISKEKIDLIFDKYYTSESNVLDAANTGIGLSYIKDLIYLMEGEVRVESEIGKGTKFTVYLPVMAEKVSAAQMSGAKEPKLAIAREEATQLLNNYNKEALDEDTVEQSQDSGLPKILLVEDNPDMLALLESILQNKYHLTKVSNGSIGLEMTCQQPFDLIISDVMMPEMDGITFCGKVKENFATSHIPIILLTAKVMEESKMSGYMKGADDYITKPFNPELLLIRVENLLQQRRKLQEVFNKEFMLTPKAETITSPDEEFLSRIVELMNENLGEAEFNVETMCKSMHLSHMHFIRKVKQLTGKKPIDLLKSFRMKKAKDLLSQQKLTIAEVAYRVGFDLPNSFSRAFKKEFNQTPTQYINNLPPQKQEVAERGVQI